MKTLLVDDVVGLRGEIVRGLPLRLEGIARTLRRVRAAASWRPVARYNTKSCNSDTGLLETCSCKPPTNGHTEGWLNAGLKALWES